MILGSFHISRIDILCYDMTNIQSEHYISHNSFNLLFWCLYMFIVLIIIPMIAILRTWT